MLSLVIVIGNWFVALNPTIQYHLAKPPFVGPLQRIDCWVISLRFSNSEPSYLYITKISVLIPAYSPCSCDYSCLPALPTTNTHQLQPISLAKKASSTAILPKKTAQVEDWKAHNSMQLTLKSEVGVREGFPKVLKIWSFYNFDQIIFSNLHSCDRPLFRSSSNQRPNLPALAPMTRLVAHPLMNNWLAVVHVYTCASKHILWKRRKSPRDHPIGKRRANTLHYLGWDNLNSQSHAADGNSKTGWFNRLNQQVSPFRSHAHLGAELIFEW